MPRHTPRVVLASHSRQERQRRRQGIRLKDFTITEKTRLRYEKAVAGVLPVLENLNDLLSLDEVLCDWIEVQWVKGTSLNDIADTLSGLHFFWPEIKGRIREAWRYFKSWRRIESPVRATPLTCELARAFVAHAVEHERVAYALLLALGFHCLLRAGELLNLRFGDIDFRDEVGVVSLRASKTGLRTGAMEAVAVREPLVLQLLATVYSVTPHFAGDLIWPHSAQRFREQFRASCSFFHVDHLNYKPYSLRRGGATLLLQFNTPLEIILVRGRWRSVAVARLYLEDGLAQLPSLRLPSLHQQLVSKFASFTPSTAFRP